MRVRLELPLPQCPSALQVLHCDSCQAVPDAAVAGQPPAVHCLLSSDPAQHKGRQHEQR